MLVLCVSTIFVANAQEVSNELTLSFYHIAGKSDFVFNDQIYTTDNTTKITFSRAQLYLSNFTITHDGGVETPIPDSYLLISASTEDYSLGNFPFENIEGVSFYVGIDSITNHGDPSVYPDGNPLANQNPEMHWGWAAGYRFLAIEGNYDAANDNTFQGVFQYHSVGDAYYKQLSFSINDATASDEDKNLVFELDWLALLNGVDIAENSIIHGSGNIVDIIMENEATPNTVFTWVNLVTGVADIANDEFAFYPNPCQQQIHFTTSNNQYPVQVNLLDMMGRKIATYQVLTPSQVLTLPTNFTQNMFLLQWQSQDGHLGKKMMVKY